MHHVHAHFKSMTLLSLSLLDVKQTNSSSASTTEQVMKPCKDVWNHNYVDIRDPICGAHDILGLLKAAGGS